MNHKQTLNNRRVLLGVTGGIAAYKSAELIRRLQDLGADVRVVMTSAAQAFITPLTLQALSGKPVHTDLLDTDAEAAMGHIELARWADLILVAPASADCLARLAQGCGDDLLTTVCLASRCAIAIAPAMNQAMWHKPATEANLRILKQRNYYQFGPDAGGQACGDVGLGRMSDPEALAESVLGVFQTRALEAKRVVITAGPTREAIDPVRYLSNYSSGKMGYALAQAAADAGAKTLLISGPTSLAPPERVEFQPVVCAQDMYAASMAAVADCDIFIAAAAVADFRPATVARQKIKKTGADTLAMTLVKNPDIVAAVAAVDKPPFVVGFAAETQHVVDYAREKLFKKKLDLIIANDVSDPSIGFNSDSNAVVLITADRQRAFARSGKPQLARDIIQAIGLQLCGKSMDVFDV
ncbi:MAG: bifunctional phosphopantothenoylcysteine decarboxylase/phosphopantothenate--cysteine ligase CoaBC [Cellvibrionaceae bacterium]|nr:bifunctional phosphopantothenoylcysteine decarboxylase/phosphopantothenate--cysteine ligase CoaBC [Cellvibrionaceae bacterium]